MTDLTFPEVVDASMLACFKSCPQLFKKVYIDQWKSRGEKVDLHAGKAYAYGMEICRRAFYEEGNSAEVAQAKGLAALLSAYGDYECPADNPKSAERMAGAFEFTMQHYPLSMDAGFPVIMPGGKRAIEVSFTHPIGILHPETDQPLLYCGRGDMICNYAGGVYLEDDKTTRSLGPTWSRQWDLRSQFLGYTWGFRQSGLNIAGVLVRGVSILKTKFDTQEAICNFSDFEVDRWYNELIEWVADMKVCWERKRWKYNFDHACTEFGGCGFRTVCKSEDERPWLEQFFERRRWDPVTRQEVKLP